MKLLFDSREIFDGGERWRNVFVSRCVYFYVDNTRESVGWSWMNETRYSHCTGRVDSILTSRRDKNWSWGNTYRPLQHKPAFQDTRRHAEVPPPRWPTPALEWTDGGHLHFSKLSSYQGEGPSLEAPVAISNRPIDTARYSHRLYSTTRTATKINDGMTIRRLHVAISWNLFSRRRSLYLNDI